MSIPDCGSMVSVLGRRSFQVARNCELSSLLGDNLKAAIQAANGKVPAHPIYLLAVYPSAFFDAPLRYPMICARIQSFASTAPMSRTNVRAKHYITMSLIFFDRRNSCPMMCEWWIKLKHAYVHIDLELGPWSLSIG